MRTLRLALQSKIGGDPIGLDHAIVPWLIKHAGQQITRYQIRACGKTSFRRIKGYNCSDPVAEFGECVLFMPPATASEKRYKNSWSERFVHGVWLGLDVRTGANIIGTPDGVYTGGKINRKAVDERWSREAVDNIKGCPQQVFARPRMQNYKFC